MKNIFKLKKFKKAIIGISAISFDLSIGLTARLITNTIAISLLKDKMKAPINKGYVNNWTSIATKDAFISTANKSAFDYAYDFVSLMEMIWNYVNTFKLVSKIISTLCSVASFAVPSSSLVRKLISYLLRYIEGSIISSQVFQFIKKLILILKKRFL